MSHPHQFSSQFDSSHSEPKQTQSGTEINKLVPVFWLPQIGSAKTIREKKNMHFSFIMPMLKVPWYWVTWLTSGQRAPKYHTPTILHNKYGNMIIEEQISSILIRSFWCSFLLFFLWQIAYINAPELHGFQHWFSLTQYPQNQVFTHKSRFLNQWYFKLNSRKKNTLNDFSKKYITALKKSFYIRVQANSGVRAINMGGTPKFQSRSVQSQN